MIEKIKIDCLKDYVGIWGEPHEKSPKHIPLPKTPHMGSDRRITLGGEGVGGAQGDTERRVLVGSGIGDWPVGCCCFQSSKICSPSLPEASLDLPSPPRSNEKQAEAIFPRKKGRDYYMNF